MIRTALRLVLAFHAFALVATASAQPLEKLTFSTDWLAETRASASAVAPADCARAREAHALKHFQENDMTDSTMYPAPSRELTTKRSALAPKANAAFLTFSDAVFAEGALSKKIKQVIAVAVAHVTQCPYCIRGHTRAALKAGATREEIMEAIWVAAEMRAGAAYAHSALALDEMDKVDQRSGA
jgi:AhpD family alkylhydroperoxidase